MSKNPSNDFGTDLLVVAFQVLELESQALNLAVQVGFGEVCIINDLVQRTDLLLHSLPKRLLIVKPTGSKRKMRCIKERDSNSIRLTFEIGRASCRERV